jgi:tRNA(Met) cytidine acetyltransferase
MDHPLHYDPHCDTSSRESLIAWVLENREQARKRGHRYLLCLSGPKSWCIDHAQQLVRVLRESNGLWIGEKSDAPCPTLDNARALTRLGSETALLVYDSHCGFDPDAFGALSGTLKGGGLLLLLTPPLADWPAYPDPQRERIAVANYDITARPSLFLERLARQLLQDPSITLFTPQGLRPGLPAPVEALDPPVEDEWCRTPDQVQAVQAIIHTARGHRKRPLVLTADRGRGKSAALGIAAARLIAEGYAHIQITAPSRQTLSSFYTQISRYEQHLESSGSHTSPLLQALEFVAPDDLLNRSEHADLLLVDEAAAIPTPLLQGLLKKFPRIVFATTVHGYEGTGMGFAHRFKKHLDQVRPQWREFVLRDPIRWRRNDPLERTVFRLLALDAEPANETDLERLDIKHAPISFPDQKQLLESEADLRQLFGLLILAHYRTTPLDLRQLLDGPNLQVMLVRQNNQIIGVALLASEGEFTDRLAQDIWSGIRRPRGHLLAQSLTAHLGLPYAATLRGLRIMRIAVHPARQGRGLGRHMLEAIETYAREQRFDYLGVSCGATPDLIRFWQHNRLQAVRLGIRSGASSSAPSVMFLRGLSTSGRTLQDEARERFARQLPGLLAEPLREFPAQWLGPMLTDLPCPGLNTLTHQDWLDLVAFAFSRRGYEISQAPINLLVWWGLAHQQFSGVERELLITRVLQRHAWQHCARSFGLPGRKAVEARIRQTLRPLLQQQCDASIGPWINALREGGDPHQPAT